MQNVNKKSQQMICKIWMSARKVMLYNEGMQYRVCNEGCVIQVPMDKVFDQQSCIIYLETQNLASDLLTTG